MNLSKIEKAFIIILVVGAIIVGGIFLFIMPAKDGIDAANSRHKTLVDEQTALNEKLAREATIDNEIKTAKEDATTLEGNFYPDLTTYEAVEIVQAHLNKCNLTTLGIEAAQLTTADLELEILDEKPVIYDLKTYSQSARGADDEALLEGQFKDGDKVYTITISDISNITISDENGNVIEPKDFTDTMTAAYKEALCKYAVTTETKQMVGVTEVALEVKGLYKDYLEFIDYIYDLDRASYMPEVTFPMTYTPEDDDTEEGEFAAAVEDVLDVEVLLPVEDDTEVKELAVIIRFYSVEQMEELETIDASGTNIVVNQ